MMPDRKTGVGRTRTPSLSPLSSRSSRPVQYLAPTVQPVQSTPLDECRRRLDTRPAHPARPFHRSRVDDSVQPWAEPVQSPVQEAVQSTGHERLDPVQSLVWVARTLAPLSAGVRLLVSGRYTGPASLIAKPVLLAMFVAGRMPSIDGGHK